MSNDLTPQEPRPQRTSRRWLPAAIAVGVAAVVVILVVNLLGGSLFFYNADDAIARRGELGDDRFTLQGAPVGCTIVKGFQDDKPVVAFSVAFGGESVDVVHLGDPAELFQPGIPVVLDGSWVNAGHEVDGFTGLADDGWYFASDRMRVKHDNDYRNDEDYDDRVAESERVAEESASACST